MKGEPMQDMVPHAGVREGIPDDKLAQDQARHQEHGRVRNEKAERHVGHHFHGTDSGDLGADDVVRLSHMTAPQPHA